MPFSQISCGRFTQADFSVLMAECARRSRSAAVRFGGAPHWNSKWVAGLRTDLPKQSQDVLKVCVLGGTSKARPVRLVRASTHCGMLCLPVRGRTLVYRSTWKIIG